MKTALGTSQKPRLTLFTSLLRQPHLGVLSSDINEFYHGIERAETKEQTAFIDQIRALGEKFVPTASSATVGAALSGAKICYLLKSLTNSSAGAWIRGYLGPAVAIDLDQSWVRRQYAPCHYPPLHAPHQWHQDGALGLNFLSVAAEAGCPQGLLEMITIWIALGPCGTDAPGLEIVSESIEGLLQPEQLAISCVCARFVPEIFWKPVLSGGDALLFSGDILHRTHVTSCMSQDRTSIELRCFAAQRLPSRLQGDRFVLLPSESP